MTEAVLSRLRHPAGGVYDWVLEALDQSGRVLDVACGSAPSWSSVGDGWIGIDFSEAELALARRRGARPLVHADATALPVATARFDTVLCLMGLMLFEPLEQAASELGRVIDAGGCLVALVPATRPVRTRDRVRYARLLAALRRRHFAYPEDPEHIDAVLERRGFDVVNSERRSFRYPIDEPVHARLLIDSLYLPGTSDERVARAQVLTRRWIGTSIGVPLRRLVAVRRPV
ncbi:MAG TPA: methyltransferase domain-containing protein [Acidimicrobiia bacterium]